jgi:hypothetical protein
MIPSPKQISVHTLYLSEKQDTFECKIFGFAGPWSGGLGGLPAKPEVLHSKGSCFLAIQNQSDRNGLNPTL